MTDTVVEERRPGGSDRVDEADVDEAEMDLARATDDGLEEALDGGDDLPERFE